MSTVYAEPEQGDPATDPDSDLDGAAARLRQLVAIAVAAWLCVGVLHLVRGREIAVLHISVAATLWLVRAWGTRGSGRVVRAAHLCVGGCVAGLGVLGIFTGQEQAMALWFLPTAPLMAGWMIGTRAAAGWAGIAILVSVVVALSARWVQVPPAFETGMVELMVNRALMVLVVLGFARIGRRTMDERLDRIALQATELRVARDEAVAARMAMSQFLARMSHELRTPLNAIIGFSKVLNRTAADDLGERGTDYLGRIERSGRHLLTLINELLDMAKIESGELSLRFEPVELGPLVEEVFATLSERAHERGLALVFEPPGAHTHPVSDPVRLRQILLNLVGNAIKFTDQGRVCVIVHATGADGPPTHIDVTDTGIGIEADALDRIFEPFVQADGTTSRRYGGTGLGLPISHQLAELLGHRLTVQSTPGQGSTFSLWFDGDGSVAA